MKSISKGLSLICTMACAFSLQAADNGKFAKELPTLMSERGKLLMSDDFSGPAIDSKWKVAKGKWEIAGDALKGVELKADNHAASVRRQVDYHNAVIQLSFKFDGGKQFSVSLNDKNGHVCRAVVSPTRFTVQKDKSNKKSTDKPARLGEHQMTFQPGHWYELVMEVQGKEILTSIGEGHVAYGEHAGMDIDKSDIGLPVSGDHVSFGYIRVWEGTPKKGWDKNSLSAKK